MVVKQYRLIVISLTAVGCAAITGCNFDMQLPKFRGGPELDYSSYRRPQHLHPDGPQQQQIQQAQRPAQQQEARQPAPQSPDEFAEAGGDINAQAAEHAAHLQQALKQAKQPEPTAQQTQTVDDRWIELLADSVSRSQQPQQAARTSSRQMQTNRSANSGTGAGGQPQVQWLDGRHQSARDEAAPTYVQEQQQPRDDMESRLLAAIDGNEKQSRSQTQSYSRAPQRDEWGGSQVSFGSEDGADDDGFAAAPRVNQPVATSTAKDSSSRQARIQQLLNEFRKSDDPAESKVMALTALSMLDSEYQLTSEDLAGLSPQQRQTLRGFYVSLLRTQRKIAENGGRVDPAAMDDHVDQIFGRQPINISKVRLCRSVSGFGVYEPFADTTFQAGRQQAMILYVELENYRVVQDSDGYQVRLTQEVELYTDSDGLRVWYQPKQKIIDDSQNRRRDFYTVQMLHLPARLGVGKFRLKIRVTDETAGSFDEWTVPLDMVVRESTAKMKISEPFK